MTGERRGKVTLMRWMFQVTLAGLTVVAAVSPGTARGAQTRRAPRPTWQVLFTTRAIPSLSHPGELAIDRRGSSASKWMYVVDSGNNRVLKLGTGGRYIGDWGAAGTGPSQFQQPGGIATGPNGDVYVADTGNNRVQRFDSNGRFLSQWGTMGTGTGQFMSPAGVAAGGSGNVFVADRENGRILKFSPSGRQLATWPVSIPTGSGQPGLGKPGPYALTIDGRGNVYVAVDTGQCSGGHCVMDYIVLEKRSPTGAVVWSAVGGNPYGGYRPIPPIKEGSWWQIGALAAESHGHLWVSEWSSNDQASITELSSSSGARIGRWELPGPSGPRGWPARGISLDPRGNVYVSDTLANRVLKLMLSP
jgi:tripartite motif-containing protein 71